jgi:hypothetical protein
MSCLLLPTIAFSGDSTANAKLVTATFFRGALIHPPGYPERKKVAVTNFVPSMAAQ